ncbi:hypothetical protein CPJCM30710_29550 [Clostridium polyendosporum]|uniref:Uncharacterized protein n=1 Tax=Clostridium polyendosporum TaxID=69208 RepID=A0A919S2J4_9CLOT|nr:hypothetical protein [Clostridium polyendosporum]GIM30289.1 hypothetical protein CPJCM30710_29550 [Clostridium polyendosporum]
MQGNKQITVISVQTTDPNVKLIEAGSGPDKQRKPIDVNETVIFSWDKVIPFNEINAVAYNKNNVKVYEYRYPKNTTIIRTEDLRWYGMLQQITVVRRSHSSILLGINIVINLMEVL